MDKLCKGLVLYQPGENEIKNLKKLLDIHIKTKPNVENVVKRHTTKKGFFSKKVDWKSVKEEVSNLSLGWFVFLDVFEWYLVPFSWVSDISDVVAMLSIGKECYIKPSQAESVLVARNLFDKVAQWT